MGRGTWYYSLGVSSIVDAFVRVDGRSYLLSGAIDSSEANGIIRDPKSCKVRVGSNGNLLWEASVFLGRKKGADDFVVYYDARSKDLEAGLEKGEGDCLYVATTEDFMILCVLYVFGVGYVILDNQSIERDRLNGIGFVLNFVKFISFTFGDKEMILVIEAVSR
ncbi:hypothetical protein Tco_0045561 [Tanacetum coccineum]